MLAWFWARMASVAKSNTKHSDTAFYRSKVEIADFYFKKILPRSQALKIQIKMVQQL
ncbi:MAG: acyl-CoA dehydrogenase C-terminal domain-containing protein [Pseudomonadota bacterium]|nr:acyl-CoA dehydrogenase C-terminal domain-containing protein [Pseudomonadota bacterium]